MIKKGNQVKMKCLATLDDGTVLENYNNHSSLFEFEFGSGMILSSIENELKGMEEGEEKEFSISPKNAFGFCNPNLVMKINKDQVPLVENLHQGMSIIVTFPDGFEIPGIVTEIADRTFTVDLNHPLAGKTLHIKVRIMKIWAYVPGCT
ncbi:MAG: peptidylprolyl isomerase [Candidatus Heimdallarchaeota archaeon]